MVEFNTDSLYFKLLQKHQDIKKIEYTILQYFTCIPKEK